MKYSEFFAKIDELENKEVETVGGGDKLITGNEELFIEIPNILVRNEKETVRVMPTRKLSLRERLSGNTSGEVVTEKTKSILTNNALPSLYGIEKVFYDAQRKQLVIKTARV